jgi:hypothetical protein
MCATGCETALELIWHMKSQPAFFKFCIDSLLANIALFPNAEPSNGVHFFWFVLGPTLQLLLLPTSAVSLKTTPVAIVAVFAHSACPS